jgi:hypothetical protein
VEDGTELETVKALKAQQELPKMLTSISTNMWSSANPGYILSATPPASASKAAHKVWQGAEVRQDLGPELGIVESEGGGGLTAFVTGGEPSGGLG